MKKLQLAHWHRLAGGPAPGGRSPAGRRRPAGGGHHLASALRHQRAPGLERCPGQGQGRGHRLDPHRRRLERRSRPARDGSPCGSGPRGQLCRRQRPLHLRFHRQHARLGQRQKGPQLPGQQHQRLEELRHPHRQPLQEQCQLLGHLERTQRRGVLFPGQGRLRPESTASGRAGDTRCRPGGIHRRARARPPDQRRLGMVFLDEIHPGQRRQLFRHHFPPFVRGPGRVLHVRTAGRGGQVHPRGQDHRRRIGTGGQALLAHRDGMEYEPLFRDHAGQPLPGHAACPRPQELPAQGVFL